MEGIQWNLLNTNAPAQAGMGIVNGFQQGMEGGQKMYMNQLAIRQAREQEAQQEELRNALMQTGGDVNQVIPQVMMRNPKLGMDLQKSQSEQMTAEIEREIKLQTVRQNSANAIATAPDGMVLQTAFDTLQRSAQLTGATPEQVAQAQERLQMVFDTKGEAGLRKEASLQTLQAKDRLSKIQMVDVGDRVIPTEMNPNAEGFNPQPIQKGMAPGKEEELYLRGEQIKVAQGNLAARENKLTIGGKERPLVAQAMSTGLWMPSGRMTGPQLDAFEAAMQVAVDNGDPLEPEDLRNMEFQALKNRATGQSAGSRLVVARKQNIEAATGLLRDMEVTANKIDFSNVKISAIADKWVKGQLQDPDLVEYMTQRADALFALGNALKQNGITDKAIEVEEEAAAPTVSPKAFKAWFNTQMRALDRAGQEMNADYKYDIPKIETAPPGQGGVMSIKSDADYDALPSGSVFIAPDGSKRRKP